MYEYNTSTPRSGRIHLTECGHANSKSGDSWDRVEPNWSGPICSKEEVAHQAKSTGREVRVAGCCRGKIDL